MITRRFIIAFLLVVGMASFISAAEPLGSLKTMAFVLQAEGLGKPSEAIDKLKNCNRDLLVIDYAFYGDAETKWTPAEIAEIREGKEGRRVVAYLSIGEAGTYRYYWQKTWDADSNGKPDEGAPAWLLPSNPDWPDNYKVHYWDPAWQAIVLKHLDEILAQGFDGVYLDLVDAFEYFEHDEKRDRWLDHRPNPITGKTYREDMIVWVTKIAKHARTAHPGFFIIPQNGQQLLADDSFIEVIDAVGVEDLFTNGNRIQKPKATAYRNEFLQAATAAKKPVFAIEYCRTDATQKHAVEGAKSEGYRLLITDRNLKTLGAAK